MPSWDPHEPSTDEIERAWRRPIPPRAAEELAYARSMHRGLRGNWRRTKFGLFAYLFLVSAFAATAAADLALDLGWGHTSGDLMGALLMVVLGVAAFPLFWLMNGLLTLVVERVHGPDADAAEPSAAREPPGG